MIISDIQLTSSQTKQSRRCWATKMARFRFFAIAGTIYVLLEMYHYAYILGVLESIYFFTPRAMYASLMGECWANRKTSARSARREEVEKRGKISAHFDARKFDFITSAVKRVTIRILMGRLLGLKTSTMRERATARFAAFFPINRRLSNSQKTHERLGRIYWNCREASEVGALMTTSTSSWAI